MPWWCHDSTIILSPVIILLSEMLSHSSSPMSILILYSCILSVIMMICASITCLSSPHLTSEHLLSHCHLSRWVCQVTLSYENNISHTNVSMSKMMMHVCISCHTTLPVRIFINEDQRDVVTWVSSKWHTFNKYMSVVSYISQILYCYLNKVMSYLVYIFKGCSWMYLYHLTV